ncbi:MAG: helix-turn-helix domain-containing protein [Thermoanaerobacteraceae bacterium]|nr:helix-turn-helix domain-containing protein [Thermoanaerobacteraceae bacterium]
MGQIGELLTRIRKKKDLTLRDVEQATKIRIKYLQALENEDYDEIPGEVYVIGFLRTYCRFLGLDADVVVREYKEQTRAQQLAETETKAEETAETTGSHRGKAVPISKIVVPLVAILILAFLGIMIVNHGILQPDTVSTEQENVGQEQELPGSVVNDTGLDSTPVTGAEEEHVEEKQVQEENTAKQEELVSEGVNVEFLIEEGKCWIEVKSDDQVIYRGLLTGPVVKEFHADKRMEVVFGNAGVVRVTVNGEDLGIIGGMGERVVKVFTSEE